MISSWSGARLAAGCAALGLAVASCGAPPPAAAPPPAPPPPPIAPAVLNPAQIAAKVTPGVVTVRSPGGLGTGFVVKKEGWIATNLHVILGATALVVATPDRREYPVLEVLAVDDARDLALLRIEAPDLSQLALGDSDAVHAGDSVVAIGHPLGLEDTVSNGLVSAIRVIDPSITVLQISAPIAPGSSGGPLLSDKGEVIGVATAYSTAGQNLNFGVPVRYLEELIHHPRPVPMAAFAAQNGGGAEALPTIKRDVPKHELKLLDGCSAGDLELIGRSIGEAIQIGAPIYNERHYAACFHVYEGAALDVEKRLPASCKGPKAALRDGRGKAGKLDDPSAQAWAMRDAFDGLLQIIAAKLERRKPAR